MTKDDHGSLVRHSKYSVRLAKSYCDPYGHGDQYTVEGTIEVEAASPEEAEEKVNEMMNWDGECLQTIDPRITWEDKGPDGWDYADFSFRVLEGETEERA